MTKKELLTIKEKANCNIDFLSFIRTCFEHNHKLNFVVNSHHEIIADALISVFLGDIKRLIINVPPRYGKTEIAVINFIAWAMGICGNCKFIHVSYSKKLASHNTYKTKQLVESEIYRQIFPKIKIKQDSKAKDNFTAGGSVVYASGVEGSITGFGAGNTDNSKFGGAIIIDDPHKPQEINSIVARENVINFFRETLESRKNNTATPIILIMQRLHVEDLSGFLLSGGNGEKWEHINLPVLNNGVALWEYKQNIEELERLEKYNRYVFAGQYMQDPTPIGGAMFKDEYFKFYNIPPQDIHKYIITCDTAMKTKEYNDFTVFQLWAKAKHSIYLIDQIRGKWEAPELRKRALLFWHKHDNPKLTYMYIEDKSSGVGLIQDLQSSIRIMPVKRNIDKVTRAFDGIPHIESGFVYLPEKAIFTNDLIVELTSFNPKMTHSHDDQVDCLLDAVDILLITRQRARAF